MTTLTFPPEGQNRYKVWNHWADENAWGGLGLNLTISQLQGMRPIPHQSFAVSFFPAHTCTCAVCAWEAQSILHPSHTEVPYPPRAARQGRGGQHLERHKKPLQCICTSAQPQLHVWFVGAFQTTKGFCWFKVNIIFCMSQCDSAGRTQRKGAGLGAVRESNFIYWKAPFLLIIL